ncbi:hypothetical protein [Sphingobacterium kitahiroshimense]
MENITPQELMHFTALFYHNWNKSDFELAFSNSRLGWDYHWNKLQNKKQDGANATQAVVSVVLNMDDEHQKMLVDYILNVKYAVEIFEHKEWQLELSKHKEKNN